MRARSVRLILPARMTALVAGLVLFLGVHSVRIVADDWRSAQVARIGRDALARHLFAGLARRACSSSSGATARRASIPSSCGRRRRGRATSASLLVLPSFVLIVAGNMRGTKMKAALGHPMVLGTKLWAFAHLHLQRHAGRHRAVRRFLAWAIADYASARRRDRAAGIVYPPGSIARDAIAVVDRRRRMARVRSVAARAAHRRAAVLRGIP